MSSNASQRHDRLEHEELCEIVVTAPDADWLAALTHELVQARLVAGGHQVEPVRSTYRWQGSIHSATEARATLRTRLSLFDQVARRIAAKHPYETPSIIALPIREATPQYRAWILDQTDVKG